MLERELAEVVIGTLITTKCNEASDLAYCLRKVSGAFHRPDRACQQVRQMHPNWMKNKHFADYTV